jgi:serine/threonine protein kinase
MESERWGEIKQIVNACLELDAGQRESHIAELCSGDAELITEVRSLLRSHAEMGDFLAVSALEDDELLTGRQVGHYQLREPIAEGGMGTVYRAVRSSDFEKQVAIKLVKRGMDTDFILRRFRHERQILAGLDHPNIARLLDGGAAGDGRPYLVMEYIEGTPITDYAERHGLKVQQRLELFRTVCAAVQYAHQNLVVHRDLKPGNILVTADGTPKLLDFGIAKLLEPDADRTMTSLRLMTPECASPEQVRGQPITTASDIYSLGVLLYHLLTGERPYRFTTKTPEEVARVVCETEPKRPSALRSLSDDLDNIVLKAMHKEPSRRYASAEQLAEDIRRYLEGLPVTARKDTFGYRARKFVGRHRAASLAATLVALSITAGMGATLWEAHVARMERARSESRFNDVRQLADSLIFELHDAIQQLPGSTAARKLLIDRGLHYLDTLAKESSDDLSLQRDIAGAYERVGLVQGRYGDANLGDSAGALRSLQKALAVRQSITRNNPASGNDSRALAGSYRVLASQLLANGAPNAALTEIQKATRISEDLRKRGPGDVETLRELGSEYDAYGVIQGGSPGSMGDIDGALASFRKAIAVNEAMLKIDPHNDDAKRALEKNYIHLGAMLLMKGDFKEGLISRQKSLELARELASGSVSAVLRRDLAVACNQIAASYESLGDFKQALASYLEGRKIYRELAAADRANATVQRGLAIADLNVGNMLAKTGRARQGLALMDDAVRIDEGLMAADPANSVERSRLSQIYVARAEARERSGMLGGALSDFQKALNIVRTRAGQDPGDASTQVQVEVARNHLAVARLSAKMGLNDQAAASFHKALDLSAAYARGSWAKLKAQEVAAEAYSGLGNIASARGSNAALPIAQRIDELNAARSHYQKSLGLWQSIIKPDTVSSGSGADPKRLAGQIAGCDRQLTRLRRTIASPPGP